VREPYRYEREVEEFLRWSPHVRREGERQQSRLSSRDLVELRSLLDAYAETAGLEGWPASGGVPAPSQAPHEPDAADDEAAAPIGARPADLEADPTTDEHPPVPHAPVEHYDDLEAEEVISLLGSLDEADLRLLLDHERSGAARAVIVDAIEGVLARREAAPR
jgi:hypothetical protein